MVSFQCESCGDVLTKKKLDAHRSRCRGATFSCIDCMVHFYGTEYRSHTSCMTEDQKYQGALYKNKNKKVKLNPEEASRSTTPRRPNNTSNMAAAVQQPRMSHAAYMEDVPEGVSEFLVADDGSDDDAPPHAPTPPPATESPVNVFDFLVASASTTPNASNFNLPHGPAGPARMGDRAPVAPFDRDTNALAESTDFDMDDAKHTHLVEYGTGPVPVDRPPFQTPAPADRERAERRKKEGASTDKDVKKDKKRKRLTLDMDRSMLDTHPAVLHSGLTGGLNRMSTKTSPDFPPSPESAETPITPLKKTKPSKHSKSRSPPVANGFFSSLAAKPKSKKRKQRSTSPSASKKPKERHHRHSSSSHHHGDKVEKGEKGDKPAATQKLLEFPCDKKDDSETHGQIIVFKPQADLFLSFVNKGPESERGCSMNKALRRFHRERKSQGVGKDKHEEEKELFRVLRLRKNDRGETVLFCVDE